MLANKLQDIFHKVQQNASCHQKCREIVRKLYNESRFEDFEIEFMRCIEILFWQDVTHKNIYVERSLEFAATFLSSLVSPEPNDDEEDDASDSAVQTHPFLTAVIRNTLSYHHLDIINARYRSCQFINLILRNLGADVHIENELWNVILDALLERIKDVKPTVRLQAIKALARLQSPTDNDCPVIQAFLERMYDISSTVRREIVELLAPCYAMSAKIVEKARDSDHTVRLAAYRKCAHMGPKLIKVVHRQSVIISGFNEMNEAVKRCFLETTLPKWLSAYDGNFLKFLYAIKLDAFEEDIKKTETISKQVLEVFFKTCQLSTIVEYLPIDENKVIPIEKLNYESALYWCILVNYLRQSDNTEEYLDSVIPELVPFCKYIERIIRENTHSLEGWKYVEYQHILCQLFQILGKYDLDDEMGRKIVRTLVVDMFTAIRLDGPIIKEMIFILEKMNPVLDALTIDICSIISDIREPMVVQPPSQETITQHNFKLAQYRVRMNELSENRDDAVTKCDYKMAAEFKKDLDDLNKEVAGMVEKFEASKSFVKTSQVDPEMLCRCLNILIEMLSHPKLKTLTTSLRSCRDEFVLPLLENNDREIYWRVYKCMTLYCTLDKQIASQNLRLICTQIVFYRLARYDEDMKSVLLIAIAAVSDILRLYGPDIFQSNDSNNTNTTVRQPLNGTRRLYTIEQLDDTEQFDRQAITLDEVVEALLDMLDDENGDVREQTCQALCNLLDAKIAVSSTFLAKLVLTWFNPLTEKSHPKVQQLLGNTFIRFATKDSNEELLEQMVIPVLTHIGNAPHSSPLVDIDLDNALRFLGAITSIKKPTALVNIHKNLAYSLCHKIAAKPDDKCVSIYIRMLLNLELFLEDTVVIQELINQAELILDDVADRARKRNVEKFVGKLKIALAEIINDEENETVAETEAAESTVQSEMSTRTSLPQASIVESGKDSTSLLQDSRKSGSFLPRDRQSDTILPKRSDTGNRTRGTSLPQVSIVESGKDSTCLLQDSRKSGSFLSQDRQSDSILPKSSDTGNRTRGKSLPLNDAANRKSITSLPRDNDTEKRRGKLQNGIKQNKDTQIDVSKRNSINKNNSGASVIKNNNIEESLRCSMNSLSTVNLDEKTPLKRRKQRGRRSKGSSIGANYSDDTILHTIIEDDAIEMGSLHEDDMTIQTSTTTASPNNTSSSSGSSKRRGRPKKVLVSETSSDSDAPQQKTVRRSIRKRHSPKIY